MEEVYAGVLVWDNLVIISQAEVTVYDSHESRTYKVLSFLDRMLALNMIDIDPIAFFQQNVEHAQS